MVRILQVFAKLGRGGLETFIMNVYRSVDRREIQFDFLVGCDEGGYEEEVRALGGRIYILPPRKAGIVNYCRSLDGFFREHRNEWAAVHQHVSSLSSIEPQFFAKKYGIPVRILHSHSSSISSAVRGRWLHLSVHRLMKCFVKRWATNYLGCSDKALDWLYNGTGVRDKALMIHNGIRVPEFVFDSSRRADIRARLGIAEDETVIGHVGSFIKVKNHAFLLQVFSAFRRLDPNSRLLLVGDGPLRGAIMQDADRLGISDSLIMTGIRADVADLLQGMDMVVMPSLFEGLPVSLVEAQAAGLPVLASDTISKDAALTGHIGFFPLSDSPEEWAAALRRRLDGFVRRDTSPELKDAGFDIGETADMLVKLYLQTDA